MNKKLITAGIIAGAGAALVAGAFTVPANAAGAPLVQIQQIHSGVHGYPVDIFRARLGGRIISQWDVIRPTYAIDALIATKAEADATKKAVANLPKPAAGTKGDPGVAGHDGAPGVKGDKGDPGVSELAGAYYSVAKYDVGDTNGGAVATVACKAPTDVAISGGVQTLQLGTNGLQNNVPVSSSFPGRMDWSTNTPKPGDLSGWIVQFGGNSSSTDLGSPKYVDIYALCVPGANVPVNTTYSESE